jgi:hypothetical protein
MENRGVFCKHEMEGPFRRKKWNGPSISVAEQALRRTLQEKAYASNIEIKSIVSVCEL